MRTRIWLSSLTLGAALVTGGTVTAAQAASTPIDARTTTTAGHAMPQPLSVIVIPIMYKTAAECEAAGEASGYSSWFCSWGSSYGYWRLYVDTDS